MHGSQPPTRIRRSQFWPVAVVRNADLRANSACEAKPERVDARAHSAPDQNPQLMKIRRPIRRKPSPLPAPEQIIGAFSLAKNNEGSMLVERSMLTMRIERSICPRGASVRLPCLSKGACLQCVSRGASVRLQDGCSRLFWFAEDTGLFWKGSTCHSSGLSKRF